MAVEWLEKLGFAVSILRVMQQISTIFFYYAAPGNEQTVSTTLQYNEDVSVKSLRNDDVPVTLCKGNSSQTLIAGQLSSGYCEMNIISFGLWFSLILTHI